MAACGQPVAGLAFVCEGSTEKVFYRVYVERACEEAGLDCRGGRVMDTATLEVRGPRGAVAVLFHSMNSVSQMPHVASWFRGVCLPLYEGVPWHVFLCYDTDEYNADITRFHEGDWAEMRRALAPHVEEVVELAAAADIEDVMLADLPGVLRFLGLPGDTPMPYGKSGKAKLGKLFRQSSRCRAYHKGDRARPLIEALDMDTVRASAPQGIDLTAVDRLLAELCGAGDGAGDGA